LFSPSATATASSASMMNESLPNGSRFPALTSHPLIR